MKVKMGKYINFFGPFQLADLLRYVWVPDHVRYNIGEFLADTPLYTFMEWIHSKRKRTEKVKIDYYDTWNMDYTLAKIIHPMLVQLRGNSHSYGEVDAKDVPDGENLSGEERWAYVMNEMVWAFAQLSNPDSEMQFYDDKKQMWNQEAYSVHQERVRNALMLFGKYYQSLWD